jgi:ferrochelatase
MTLKKLPPLFYISFGGPEGRDDVMPFLENVTRGRNVPPERLLEVAEHYYHYDGVSPINAQNRKVIEALSKEFESRDMEVPIYFGNRNWKPYLNEALLALSKDGHRHAFAFFTSAFSSYSGCRQYRENILCAQKEMGDTAPRVEKLGKFYQNTKFIEVLRIRLQEALGEFAGKFHEDEIEVIFTAHSIPETMAKNCEYVKQLQSACAQVMSEGALKNFPHRLAYQSRSGPPHIPWLEPDILDTLSSVSAEGKKAVIVMPIGFVSDHMEVLFDLDEEAKARAKELNLGFSRAKTPGDHPLYISMIADLYEERLCEYDKDSHEQDMMRNLIAEGCREGCCLAR